MKNKRWKYYIDKDFQNQFIFQFSLLIMLNAVATLGLIWMIKEKSYNLLPDNAAVLVQVDANEAIYIDKNNEGELIISDVEGKPYFPLKQGNHAIPRLYNAFDLYFQPVLFVSLLNLFAVSIFSLFFSHKMAGPIYKIKKILREYVDRQEVEAITLRKGDFFHDLADLINRALKLEKKKNDKK
ncbi:MAG: hypothetical protein H7A24_02325 [Leptospiraceae bacterium]|nr:hypothetical protein [Leptospiraceae bacterium]MCP5510686.1 hypothetical protein [Leptospiraceae bacterium]